MAWSQERKDRFAATVAKAMAPGGPGWGAGRKVGSKPAKTKVPTVPQIEQPAPTVELPHAPEAQPEQPA